MNWANFDKPTNNLYPPIGGISVETPLPKFFLKEENTSIYTEQVTIERLDDIPLLWSLQQRIALGDILDSAIPRHWFHQGLSIGQLVRVWNTFILSQGDHRKVTVRDWVAQHQMAFEELLGEKIRDTDFTDDRLGQVLTHLSDDEAWQAIEDQLWHNSVQVYSITPQRIRLDATTAKGYHTVNEETLMQFGYSHGQPTKPQVKVMAASVDSGNNGHLVAIEVAKGQSADDPLYQPVLERMRHILQQAGLLYLGDCKMSALATRADIVAHGDFYLVPLAQVGEIPQLLSECIAKTVFGNQPATLIYAEREKAGGQSLLAAGYETTRSQKYTFPSGESVVFPERLLVIRSYSEVEKEVSLLKKRLVQATEALFQLTPEPKRGRQQILEDLLLKKALTILERFDVMGLLHYTFTREESTKTQYVGRGRGSQSRQKRTITSVRYVITSVQRDSSAIAQATWRMGWRLVERAVALPRFMLPTNLKPSCP